MVVAPGVGNGANNGGYAAPRTCLIAPGNTFLEGSGAGSLDVNRFNALANTPSLCKTQAPC
jgi:hypothetical protein